MRYLFIMLIFIYCNQAEKKDSPATTDDTLTEKKLQNRIQKQDTLHETKVQPKEDSWTAGIVDVEKNPDSKSVLLELKNAVHKDYIRLVFVFDTQLPSYHIEYVDKPVYQCGSGNAVYPKGDAILKIRFDPAAAHTEEGEATVDRETIIYHDLLNNVKILCDYEAVLELVADLETPLQYRVIELQDPVRLVLDLRL